MNIPILYHTFDATGVSMHFTTVGYFTITITIGIILILLGIVPYFISYIKKKPDMGFKKWFDKEWEKFTLKKLFSALFMAFVVLTPSYSANISKFFASGEEGNLFLEPNISDERTIPSFPIMPPEFYKKFGYDDENTLTNNYSQEFQQAIKNNEKMKQYYIPECESDNSESIICGGDKLSSVQANKDDKKVTLTPHVEIDSDKADIDVDNPKDKGVKVYYWIEETE